MKLSELTKGQVVKYRLGKHGDTHINWEDWQTGPIYVDRRTVALPARLKKRLATGQTGEIGEILVLTPIFLNKVGSWAEYGQDDYDPTSNTFSNEEFCMEIENLTQG